MYSIAIQKFRFWKGGSPDSWHSILEGRVSQLISTDIPKTIEFKIQVEKIYKKSLSEKIGRQIRYSNRFDFPVYGISWEEISKDQHIYVMIRRPKEDIKQAPIVFDAISIVDPTRDLGKMRNLARSIFY